MPYYAIKLFLSAENKLKIFQCFRRGKINDLDLIFSISSYEKHFKIKYYKVFVMYECEQS